MEWSEVEKHNSALQLVPGCTYAYVLSSLQLEALLRLPKSGALSSLHHDLRPHSLSAGVLQLSGFQPEVFTQGDVFSLGRLVDRNDREQMAMTVRDALQSGGIFELQYRIRGSGSQLRWLSERGQLSSVDGQLWINGWLLDISHQKQAEENEQVYRQLVAGTRTGFMALDEVGTVQDVNEPLLHMLGVTSAAQMQFRSVYAWVATGSQENMARFLVQVVRAGSVRDVEVDFRDAEGGILSLSLHAVATHGEYEVLIRCLMLDVTQMRQEQRELRQSRNLLAEAQRIAGLGFWVEEEGHSGFASAELLEQLGMQAEQDFGRSALLQYVVAEDRQRVQERLAQGDREVQSFSMEFELELPDGLRRIVRNNIRYEQSPGGRRLRTFGVIQDITAFRQAEQAVLHSEQRYRSLFATSIDGICMFSLSGEIEEANPAFSEILGCTAAQLCGQNERQITPAQWHAQDAQILETEIQAQDYCKSYRKEYIHVAGHLVPVSVRKWLVRDAEHQPVRIMAMVRDITEYKKIEQERAHLQRAVQQAQKMEAIGHLTGGIAHDFNNILTSILGYSDLTLRQLDDTAPPKVLKYILQIRTAGERARELISQMLIFSRGGISTGRVQPVSELVQTTMRMLRPTLPASIRIRTNIDETVGSVKIDAVQFQQVLMNLVINARDASGERGNIRIDVRNISVNQEHCASCHNAFSGDFVQIRVRDQGTGIESHVLHRIFDPFFTTKPVGQGTGMGLSVVHGIVHEFSGHLQISSQTEIIVDNPSGTELSVYLPVCAAAEAEAAQPAQIQSQSSLCRGYRVVVVDDEVAIVRMIQDLLEMQGYEVVSFAESQQALRWLLDMEQTVDLLLTDQVMPVLSGWDLSKQALAVRPELKVVMISAQADLLQRRWEQPLPWTILNKPVDAERLLLTLRDVLTMQGSRGLTG